MQDVPLCNIMIVNKCRLLMVKIRITQYNGSIYDITNYKQKKFVFQYLTNTRKLLRNPLRTVLRASSLETSKD